MSNLGFKDEPVMWIAVITAILDVVVAYGAPVTVDQKTALVGLITAVIPIVAGLVARQQVTPVAKLPDVQLG